MWGFCRAKGGARSKGFKGEEGFVFSEFYTQPHWDLCVKGTEPSEICRRNHLHCLQDSGVSFWPRDE